MIHTWYAMQSHGKLVCLGSLLLCCFVFHGAVIIIGLVGTIIRYGITILCYVLVWFTLGMRCNHMENSFVWHHWCDDVLYFMVLWLLLALLERLFVIVLLSYTMISYGYTLGMQYNHMVNLFVWNHCCCVALYFMVLRLLLALLERLFVIVLLSYAMLSYDSRLLCNAITWQTCLPGIIVVVLLCISWCCDYYWPCWNDYSLWYYYLMLCSRMITHVPNPDHLRDPIDL